MSDKRIPDIQAETLVNPDDASQSCLELTFSNGKAMTIRVGSLPDQILRQATLHGLKQKLVDAAAMSRNPDTGRAASIDDKFNAVDEVLKRLLSGEWNKTREGSATGGLLLRALVEHYAGRKDRDTIKTWLEGKTDAEKAALRKSGTIAPIIERLRAADVKSDGVDTNALLGELDD